MHHETQLCQSVPIALMDLYDLSAVQVETPSVAPHGQRNSGGTAEIIRFSKEILDFSWKEAISWPENPIASDFP